MKRRFVTIHILPYWEDMPCARNFAPPMSMPSGSGWRWRFREEILIGETAGRAREDAQSRAAVAHQHTIISEISTSQTRGVSGQPDRGL